MNDLIRLLQDTEPIIVGILNLTPDSFSGEGLMLPEEDAVSKAEEMILEGAKIIDIGGESTAPGSRPISAEEELARILNTIEVLAPGNIISVDTYKAKTALQCLNCGAMIINDVSALRSDPEMVQVIKQHEAFVILMFSKEKDAWPHATSEYREYKDILETVIAFFTARINFALNKGIKQGKIILDPGMGTFLSSNPEYSWQIIRRLDRIKEKFRDFPLMIGTSRKSFLGGSISERDPASQLTAMIAAAKGANLIRTHNVKMAAEFLNIWKRTHQK